MDPRDPFKGCWDRLDRAIAHREEAVKVWNDFLADHDAYEARVYVNEERPDVGRGSIRIWQTRDVPATLPILFGEYFYNLRAALDHAVYVTAIIDNDWRDEPPGKDVLQFPISANEDSWRKQAYHVAPPQRATPCLDRAGTAISGRGGPSPPGYLLDQRTRPP